METLDYIKKYCKRCAHCNNYMQDKWSENKACQFCPNYFVCTSCLWNSERGPHATLYWIPKSEDNKAVRRICRKCCAKMYHCYKQKLKDEKLDISMLYK